MQDQTVSSIAIPKISSFTWYGFGLALFCVGLGAFFSFWSHRQRKKNLPAGNKEFLRQFMNKPIEEEIENLNKDLFSLFQKPLDELAVYKDLGRLIKQTEVYEVEIKENDEPEGGNILLSLSSESDAKTAIIKLVRLLAQYLEDTETYQKIETLLKDFDNEKSSADKELVVQSLFSKGLMEATKTVNILKVLNQQTISGASILLKRIMLETTGNLLKDSANGWKIHILVSPSKRVEVRHVRREESIFSPFGSSSPEPARGSFVIEWELRLQFNSQLTNLSRIQLKVVNMTFSDQNLQLKVFNYLEKYKLL